MTVLGTVVVPRVKVKEAVLKERLAVSEVGPEGEGGGGGGAGVGNEVAVEGAVGGTSGLKVSMTV